MFTVYMFGTRPIAISQHVTFKDALIRWRKVYNKMRPTGDGTYRGGPCIRSGKTCKRYSCGELDRRK